MRKIFYGIAAGLLSALVSIVLAYLIGVAVILVHTRELLPTLLTAVTMLPLLLLLVLLPSTLGIGLLTGITLGIATKATSRVYIVGAVAGVLFGLMMLSGVLASMIAHPPDDFVGIVSQPFRAGSYGLVLGLIASFIFQRFNAATK